MKKVKKTPPSARATLASNLRRMRKGRQWSQEELAEHSGLHRNYIGGIERGERNVSIDNIEKIAGAFSVSLPELLKTETS